MQLHTFFSSWEKQSFLDRMDGLLFFHSLLPENKHNTPISQLEYEQAVKMRTLMLRCLVIEERESSCMPIINRSLIKSLSAAIRVIHKHYILPYLMQEQENFLQTKAPCEELLRKAKIVVKKDLSEELAAIRNFYICDIDFGVSQEFISQERVLAPFPRSFPGSLSTKMFLRKIIVMQKTTKPLLPRPPSRMNEKTSKLGLFARPPELPKHPSMTVESEAETYKKKSPLVNSLLREEADSKKKHAFLHFRKKHAFNAFRKDVVQCSM